MLRNARCIRASELRAVNSSFHVAWMGGRPCDEYPESLIWHALPSSLVFSGTRCRQYRSLAFARVVSSRAIPRQILWEEFVAILDVGVFNRRLVG